MWNTAAVASVRMTAARVPWRCTIHVSKAINTASSRHSVCKKLVVSLVPLDDHPCPWMASLEEFSSTCQKKRRWCEYATCCSIVLLCSTMAPSRQGKMVDRDLGHYSGELDANPHDARTPVPFPPLELEAEQCPEEKEDSKQLVSGALCTSDRHDWSSTKHWNRSSVGWNKLWSGQQLAAATLHQINGAAAMQQYSLWKHAQPVDVLNTTDPAERVECVFEVQRSELGVLEKRLSQDLRRLRQHQWKGG